MSELDPARRRCMKCQKMFPSTSNGNRRCSNCTLLVKSGSPATVYLEPSRYMRDRFKDS